MARTDPIQTGEIRPRTAVGGSLVDMTDKDVLWQTTEDDRMGNESSMKRARLRKTGAGRELSGSSYPDG